MKLMKILVGTITLVSFIACIACVAALYRFFSEWRFYEPGFLTAPTDLRIEDLVGVWEAHYGKGNDRLILREDYRFKQIYTQSNGYKFETGWNVWELERLGSKGFRLHLYGARFFARGPEFAQLEGMHPPEGKMTAWPIRFWDPFVEDFVEMPYKLVVQVRMLPTGELVFHHLTPLNGETILWGRWAIFRKAK